MTASTDSCQPLVLEVISRDETKTAKINASLSDSFIISGIARKHQCSGKRTWRITQYDLSLSYDYVFVSVVVRQLVRDSDLPNQDVVWPLDNIEKCLTSFKIELRDQQSKTVQDALIIARQFDMFCERLARRGIEGLLTNVVELDNVLLETLPRNSHHFSRAPWPTTLNVDLTTEPEKCLQTVRDLLNELDPRGHALGFEMMYANHPDPVGNFIRTLLAIEHSQTKRGTHSVIIDTMVIESGRSMFSLFRLEPDCLNEHQIKTLLELRQDYEQESTHLKNVFVHKLACRCNLDFETTKQKLAND